MDAPRLQDGEEVPPLLSDMAPYGEPFFCRERPNPPRKGLCDGEIALSLLSARLWRGLCV